jgi:hypothetical protein
MFTKPSVNQIEQAYTGNYQPLAQKVDQDKKQHGGIPHDLRQLLALNDIIEDKESAGIQQALNAPVDMPTVAQSMQQMAQQAIQARMMQQVHEQQRKDGKPMTVPPGVPQPEMQPRGIDSIPTDVGSGYAAGGIIGFSNGGNMPSSGELGGFSEPTPEQEAEAEIRAAEKDRAKQLVALEQKVAFLKSAGAPQAQEAQMQLDALKADMRPKPSPTDPNFRRQTDPRMSGISSVSPSTPLITGGNRPPSPPKPATIRDSAPMPAGERPAAGLDQYLVTPDKIRSQAMNIDPNQEMKDYMAMYKEMVGQQPTSGIDRMMAELERRKAKIEGEEPKPGFGGLMDYLGHIAGAGGKRWQDAGYAGGVSQRNAQKAREEQINALIEKGIDLGQKKEDIGYGFKKESFGLGIKAKEDAIKRKYDAAISQSNDNLEREKLKQQKETELARLAQMRQIPELQIAAALTNATPERRAAIEQVLGMKYKPAGTDAAILADYGKERKLIEDTYNNDIRKYGTAAEKAAREEVRKASLTELDKRYSKYNIGVQGGATSGNVVDLNSLPK